MEQISRIESLSLTEEEFPARPREPVEAEIYDKIKEFYLDISQDELAFPKLSNHKRSVAHAIADQFGLYHQSQGKGRDRHLVIKREAAKLTIGKHDPAENKWREATETDLSKPYNVENLTILTYNVLFEMEDPKKSYNFNDLVHTALRRPHNFKLLESCAADLIVLQEVTPDYHQELLKQDWVKKDFFICDLKAQSLAPGNLVLSKFPLTKVYLHQFKMSPKTMCLCKGIVNGRELSVGAVHLKAGLASTFAYIRARQVREAIQLQDLYKFDDAFLIGDFNFREASKGLEHELDCMQETSPHLPENGYTDLWISTNGESARGFTYDLERNDLARVISERVRAHEKREAINNRFDRVMYKSKDSSKPYWSCESITLVGTEPIGMEPNGKYQLFISDHFGILAKLKHQS